MTDFEVLYDSIQKRPRPEDVAQLILDMRGSDLSPKALRMLEKAAFSSFQGTYSSMAADFQRVLGADRMVATAAKNFQLEAPPSAAECLDVEKVRAFAARIGASIHMTLGQHDFLKDRLNRVQREAAGIEIQRRGYNRRVRTLRRFATRLDALVRNHEKYLATRVAKSAGASLITLEELSTDLDTACFVAYMSARLNLRSAFTNTSQVQAFDDVAQILLKRALRTNPNYLAIALVHPEEEILAQLDDEAKGRLLGMWTDVLARMAKLLETTFQENSFDLKTMIVQRGNDSSTWNAAAGAWNKARGHWLSLVYALGLESLLDLYCPGKVMRLMAADVAHWHQASGGGLDPNTLVWGDLPFPWQVFDEKVSCPRSLVEQACDRHKVPRAGWVTPPPQKQAVPYTPTPELVHGVAVHSPYLALLLRKGGHFSGKLKATTNLPPLTIHRDATGAVLGVDEVISAGV